MKFISVKENLKLAEEVKSYCKEMWEKVYQVFETTVYESLNAQELPQMWVLVDGNDKIRGFYQLIKSDKLEQHGGLSPFVGHLYVAPEWRGRHMGEMLMRRKKLLGY